MFFERRCPRCRRPARHVCGECWASLRPGHHLDLDFVDECSALYTYDEQSRPLVLAGKNGGRRDVLVAFGRQIARSVGAQPVGAQPVRHGQFDVVTWVPASTHARRRRGYDQGRLMAKAAGLALGIPSRQLTKRSDRSSQKGKGRAERHAGPALRTRARVPERILLVDDVVATGASIEATAMALRRAGAEVVVAVAVAVSVRAAPRVSSIYIEKDSAPGFARGGNREEPPWR